MRQWLEAGYFKGDLPISQQPTGPFHPLSALFPELSAAFRVVAPPTNQAEAVSVTKTENENQQVSQKQHAAPVQQSVVMDEKNRKKKELERNQQQKEAKDPNAGSAQSTQLKMMLGVSNEKPETTESKPTAKASGKKSKSSNKKAEAKATKPEMSATVAAPTPAPVEEASSAPPKPAAAAWGGVSTSKPKKSMSEIQQEEARAAARMTAQNNGMPTQPSSGWANVASGSKGWSSGVVKKASPNEVPVPAGTKVGNPNMQAPQMQTPSQAMKNTSSSGQPKETSKANSSTLAQEFGATMTPALETWCKEQMQRINGSDDLTLVAFCMSLTDASEIRQYLTTYLGSTGPVNNFATEFINRRGLGNKQEEWETPGSAKKGRKKKPGR